MTGPEGGQARLLASGSLMQQLAQVSGLVTMFAIVTVLARRLSLAELGVYGLVNSLAGYLLIVQNAAAGAAVRTMATARDDAEGSSAFSTATALYAAAGLVSGLVIAGLGVLLSGALDLSAAVEHQARVGSLLIGLVTVVGWPATIYRDALRARQLFVRSAATEIVALALYAGLMLGLVFGGASLSLVLGASGAIPLLAGAASAIVARASRLPFRFHARLVGREGARELLALAGFVSLTEASAAAIYAVNRAVLGLFRSASTVGLFEGPVRAHNLVRSVNAAVTVTVLPTASRYYAAGDDRRLAELVVRGCRYTLALIVPVSVVGMVLSGPVLQAWLGARFREAGATMAILLAHWLLNGCSGVATAVLIGVGRAPRVARWAAGVAALDLVLVLALTPLMGLEGVAVATAVPYLVMFPVLMRMLLAAVPVGAGLLVREAFVPALSVGAVLAAALGVVRALSPLASGPLVAGVALGALGLGWAAYYAAWLRADERLLVREVARSLVTRR